MRANLKGGYGRASLRQQRVTSQRYPLSLAIRVPPTEDEQLVAEEVEQRIVECLRDCGEHTIAQMIVDGGGNDRGN